jgi:hypothetical protein
MIILIFMSAKFQIKDSKFNLYTRLKIYSEQSVPPFGPSLPSPPIFTNHKEFREFLLVKCKYYFFIFRLVDVLILTVICYSKL